MTRYTTWIMALFLSISASAAVAQDGHSDDLHAPTQQLDGSPETQLTLLLSNYHEAPTLEQLEATGLPMPEALIELAEGDARLQLPRSRAIDALAHYAHHPATFDFAERFLVQPYEDHLMVLTGRTIRLVGDHLAPVDPTRAMTLLEPITEHASPVVRTHLVNSLGVVRAAVPELTPRVDEVLLQLVIAERNPAVTAAIQETLQATPALHPDARPAVNK